jgi:CRISPR-associated endonuclease/helicase Cas3
VFEREHARRRLEELGFIAGSKRTRSRPVFLCATSAGEVGVDLDADHMVCDLVAWERMVQRLGRVNRRGHGEATVVVLVAPELKAIEKEREAPDQQQRLEKPFEQLGKLDDGSFDASVRALLDLKTRASTDPVLQQIVDAATTPEPLRPALIRPLVEAWAMTSLEKHPGRPTIQPWLRGWIEHDPPQTAVVWRKHLPVRSGGSAPQEKEIANFFEAAPPHKSELLETETFRVAKWIAARAESMTKPHSEQETATHGPRLREEDVVAFALEPDGRLRRSLTLANLKPREDKKAKQAFDRLLAGATLIIDARLAGLTDGLLDENEAGVPKTADDGEPWLDADAVGFRVRAAAQATATANDRNWRERFRFALEVTADGEATRWLLVEKWRQDSATEEDRSSANPQLLDEHECWTEARARRVAKALGLDREHEDLLALAGRLHDEGKRATRWQRAFKAPVGGVYAKTEAPPDYRLLDGYRHELGSLLRVENDERVQNLSEENRDLVLHLITAHHGFARPVIRIIGCQDKPPSVLEEKAAEIALRFARLQARWGPWGLAWWESLLRAADQQASRDNDARDPAGGGG